MFLDHSTYVNLLIQVAKIQFTVCWNICVLLIFVNMCFTFSMFYVVSACFLIRILCQNLFVFVFHNNLNVQSCHKAFERLPPISTISSTFIDVMIHKTGIYIKSGVSCIEMGYFCLVLYFDITKMNDMHEYDDDMSLREGS